MGTGGSQAREDLAGADACRHDYADGPEVPRTDGDVHLESRGVRVAEPPSLPGDLRSAPDSRSPPVRACRRRHQIHACHRYGAARYLLSGAGALDAGGDRADSREYAPQPKKSIGRETDNAVARAKGGVLRGDDGGYRCRGRCGHCPLVVEATQPLEQKIATAPNFRELRKAEVRRIRFPRAWLNKGTRRAGCI